jgi:hypothetical protein
MHVSKRSALAVAGVAAIAFAVPALADQHSPAGGTGGTNQSVTCDDGYITWNPENIWPPNHKYVPVTISYYDNDGSSTDGDTTMVAVTGVTESDGGSTPMDATVAETFNGSGKPGQVDAQPDSATPTPGTDSSPATFVEDIRAERSGTDGHGSGRVYAITVQCMDNGGTTPETSGGSATFDVTVPHDQGVVKP